MPVRLVGRESFFKGKSLFEIACNVKNIEGRVVTRYAFSERYPEKSYYVLTKVIPDLSGENITGEAWGYKVFRGVRYDREFRIDSGGKRDWRLISKEDETEFCKIDKVYEPQKQIPDKIQFPPVMEYVLLRTFKQKNVEHNDVLGLMLPLKRKKNKSALIPPTASNETSESVQQT